MHPLMKIGIVLGVITVALTLGSVWFWALFGMSSDVASAWIVTCWVFGFATFLSCMMGDLSD